MEALIDGFYQIVPQSLVHIFNEYELGLFSFPSPPVLASFNDKPWFMVCRAAHQWTATDRYC